MNTCETIQQAMLAGTPAPETTAHLESCGECRKFLATLQAVEAFRGEPSADADARVLVAYRRKFGRWTLTARRVGWIAGAAGFLLLLFPLYSSLNSKAPATPAATPATVAAGDDTDFVLDQYDEDGSTVDNLVEDGAGETDEVFIDEEIAS